MKQFIKLLIVAVSFFLGFQPAFAQSPLPTQQTLSEYVSSFDSQITINQDTSLTITEQIVYVTTLNKHGIYRYVPYRYTQDGKSYTLPISNVSVTDELGRPIPFTQSKDSQNVTLKIGYPDKTFTGEQTYVITYSVFGAIDSLESADELYWDITGEGWQFPVFSSSVVVNSRFAEIQNAVCYTGGFQSTAQNCNVELGPQNTTILNEEQVAYGDNFTIRLLLNPENQLIFPSDFDLFIIWLQDNWLLFLIPLPAIILFLLYYFKGRDLEFINQDIFNLDANKPYQTQPMFSLFKRNPFVYEPLKDLSPGQAGALLDEKVDTHDIVAEILELARKKYLKISAQENKVLFFTNSDYEFSKLRDEDPTTTDLTPAQSYLFSKLFETKDVVKVSELKGKFHTSIAKAKDMMEQNLVEHNIYVYKPTKARAVATTFVFLYYFLFFQFLGFLLESVGFWIMAVFAVSVILSIFFIKQLGQKTAVGTNLFLQAKGLRESIKRGAWRERINEKHLFIEKILPFAVSLGVVNQLANDMKDLDLQPPDYIQTTNLSNFNTAAFVSSFSKEVGSSLAYNPSSSSRSGGGGFSGGGGGGGGGGSW